MALINKGTLFGAFHGMSQVAGPNERRVRSPQKASVEAGGGLRINASKELKLSGSADSFDDIQRRVDRFQKAHAVAPCPGSLRASEAKVINGHGAVERGGPLGFFDNPMVGKLVVAVDVDEVLGNFVSAINKFIADRYSSNHSVSEYYVYEFCKIWNCSPAEAEVRVHEFFKTSYFKKGILPIPGAQTTLHKLSEFCDLAIVTSRQNVIKDHTIEWIEKHYPGLFQEIQFGNHFAMDGTSRPKSDICRSLGAHVLVDDNPRYAIECADAGMRVLLFDYENSYPWSKSHFASQHPLVTIVHNWEDVEKHIFAWVASS